MTPRTKHISMLLTISMPTFVRLSVSFGFVSFGFPIGEIDDIPPKFKRARQLYLHNHVGVLIDLIKAPLILQRFTTAVVHRVTHVIVRPHYGTTVRDKHYCFDVAHFFVVMVYVHTYLENQHRFLYYIFSNFMTQTCWFSTWWNFQNVAIPHLGILICYVFFRHCPMTPNDWTSRC